MLLLRCYARHSVSRVWLRSFIDERMGSCVDLRCWDVQQKRSKCPDPTLSKPGMRSWVTHHRHRFYDLLAGVHMHKQGGGEKSRAPGLLKLIMSKCFCFD